MFAYWWLVLGNRKEEGQRSLDSWSGGFLCLLKKVRKGINGERCSFETVVEQAKRISVESLRGTARVGAVRCQEGPQRLSSHNRSGRNKRAFVDRNRCGGCWCFVSLRGKIGVVVVCQLSAIERLQADGRQRMMAVSHGFGAG